MIGIKRELSDIFQCHAGRIKSDSKKEEGNVLGETRK